MGFPRARWVCRRRNSGLRDWQPPGLPLAWQAPRRLAPQPGRHFRDWPPRAAVSWAGTSETGPPAGRAPQGWPRRAAVSWAGTSGTGPQAGRAPLGLAPQGCH